MKLHEPVGRVQILVFEIFTSANLHQITREIILLLIKDLHEKGVAESREILMAHPHYL